MVEVYIWPNSFFVGHGYVQHAGSEWHEEYCTWYDSYLIPEAHEMPGCNSFGQWTQHCFRIKKRSSIFRKKLDQRKTELDGNAVMRSRCNKKLDSEKSELELFAFKMKAGNVPENSCSMNGIEIQQSVRVNALKSSVD